MAVSFNVLRIVQVVRRTRSTAELDPENLIDRLVQAYPRYLQTTVRAALSNVLHRAGERVQWSDTAIRLAAAENEFRDRYPDMERDPQVMRLYHEIR